MKNLLTISNESLRAERRRGWGRLAAVLVVLLAAGVTILYAATFQTVTDEVVLQMKETAEGEITASWPDTVPEEVRQLLRCEWE